MGAGLPAAWAWARCSRVRPVPVRHSWGLHLAPHRQPSARYLEKLLPPMGNPFRIDVFTPIHCLPASQCCPPPAQPTPPHPPPTLPSWADAEYDHDAGLEMLDKRSGRKATKEREAQREKQRQIREYSKLNSALARMIASLPLARRMLAPPGARGPALLCCP